MILPDIALGLLWIVWFASWIAAAFWSRSTERRPGFGSEALYRIVTIAGAVMLFPSTRLHPGLIRFWYTSDTAAWALVGVAFCGFLFTWWARIHLGSLWSGWVTKKADHRVVDTGPYAIVRHPIYTGLLLGVFATAAMKGTLLALAGAGVMTIGFWIKARLEERFLRQELGAGDYDAYRRRVPMLIPFGPKAA